MVLEFRLVVKRVEEQPRHKSTDNIWGHFKQWFNWFYPTFLLFITFLIYILGVSLEQREAFFIFINIIISEKIRRTTVQRLWNDEKTNPDIAFNNVIASKKLFCPIDFYHSS